MANARIISITKADIKEAAIKASNRMCNTHGCTPGYFTYKLAIAAITEILTKGGIKIETLNEF